MVHILFLLPKELRAHRVERVAPQLMLALHKLKDIKLQPAIKGCLLRVALTVRLRRKVRILDYRLDVYKTLTLLTNVEGWQAYF
jgi:hypothetical protein